MKIRMSAPNGAAVLIVVMFLNELQKEKNMHVFNLLAFNGS